MEVASLYREPEATAAIEWPALAFRDVFKLYREGPVETVALRGLDFEVSRAELVAVLGPSGSGKSTLLHLAAGMDTPSAGDVRAFGRSLARLDELELAGYRAREVAVVFQNGNLWPTLTAEENVLVSLELAGLDGGRRRAAAALAEFGLDGRRCHRPSQLSGGEQQRTALAAAAAREAPLVLADEPTGELDADNERRVLDALRRLRDVHGATVVAVTHSPRLAEAADRVIELLDGRLRAG